MINKKNYTIGIFLDRLHESYETHIWKEISNEAQKRNINLITIEGGALTSPYYFHRYKNFVYELIDNRNIDGIISLSGSVGNFISQEELSTFYKNYLSIPIVSIGFNLEGIPSIVIDNEYGMSTLVEHIIVYHKIKKIAFIRGPINNREANNRFKAYKNMLKKYQIDFDPELVIDGDFDRYFGTKAIKILLDKRKVDFKAIVSANDYMALYALDELSKRGFKIPEDIIVAGFDNVKETLSTIPKLTTVSQPFYEYGIHAVDTILKIINNEKVKDKIVLKTKLLLRASCGCYYSGTTITLPKKNKKTINSDDIKKIIIKETNKALSKNIKILKENSNIENWIYTLVISFFDELENNPEKGFLFNLENIINQAVKSQIEIFTWHEIIKILFENIRIYTDEKYNLIIKNIYKSALFIINNIFEINQSYSKTKFKENYITLNKINNELFSAFSMNQLDKIIKEFPKIGIAGCYVLLFDDIDKKYSKLQFYYDSDKNIFLKNKRFLTYELIPGHIRNILKNFNVILLPLHFKEEEFGFIIFKINPEIEGFIYETLSSEISSAIKGANLISEITDYSKSLEKKVKDRTIELEDAYNQKTQFFINLAHEIKTPLTLIANYLEKDIKERGSSNDIIIVKENLHKLLRDVMNFMDFEKLTRGQVFYDHDKIIDLSNLLKIKIVLFREIANKKNITIESKIENFLYIKIDPFAIDRIINNLLDNAIKYTNNDGKIFINASITKNKKIELIIKDTGIGISEQQMNHIFKPFYQISHRKRNIQGLGMGLNIISEILNQINGEILIESKEKIGTIFKIYFNEHSLLENQIVEKNNVYSTPIINKTKILLKEEQYNKEKNNILIVEDNLEMLAYLQNEMISIYNIFYAMNGKEALMKLEEIPIPNLIISDIMMDEMNGYDFYEELIKSQKFQSIPIIFLSAKTSFDNKIKALSKGAIDYIYKPFVIEELLAKVNSIIQNNKINKELNILEMENRIFNALRSSKIDERKNYEEIFNEYDIPPKARQILKFLIDGKEYKEIGKELNISINTVKQHVHRIYKKFEVRNKIELLNKINKLLN